MRDHEPLIWPFEDIPAWPQYTFELRWTMADGKGNSAQPKMTAFSLEEALQTLARVYEKRCDEGGTDYSAVVYCKGVLPFHMEWFCHSTRPAGRSDVEIMQHFERYVAWVLDNRLDTDHDGPISLMGAEERWRWRGEEEGSAPPCRCKGCVESDRVRINH